MKIKAGVDGALTGHVWSPTRTWRSAEMLEHELDLAREVQESLFPAEIPALPGIRVAALNQPARIVSGDFYDIMAVDDHRTVIVCADVSGKGFAAALLAAQVQSYFRAMLQAVSVMRAALESASVSIDVFKSLGSLPLQVVTQLNTTACRHGRLPGRYATLFFAEIDGRDGAVQYVNAGHNPPLLLASGSVVELLSAGGPPVGLLSEATYEVGTVTVPVDGTLLMYTDGVVEARNRHDEEFGLSRLTDLCTSARGEVAELLPLILETVETWSAGLESADDITMVAVGRER
jgi:sigma-B regulation protein RsbU (phosphoserine phosphatase)